MSKETGINVPKSAEDLNLELKGNLQKIKKATAVGAIIGSALVVTTGLSSISSIDELRDSLKNKEDFIDQVSLGEIQEENGETYLHYWRNNVINKTDEILLSDGTAITTEDVKDFVNENTGKNDVIKYIKSRNDESEMKAQYVELENEVKDNAIDFGGNILEFLLSMGATILSCSALGKVCNAQGNLKKATLPKSEKTLISNSVDGDKSMKASTTISSRDFDNLDRHLADESSDSSPSMELNE